MHVNVLLKGKIEIWWNARPSNSVK